MSNSHKLSKAAKLMHCGQFTKARDIYASIRKTDSNNADAIALLGIANASLGEFYEAISCFRRAIQLQPDNTQLHYNLGLAYQKIGNTTEAASCYRKCLSTQPGFVPASINLALNYQDAGNYDAAASVLREALVFNPNSPQLHGSLAKVLYMQGDYREAIVRCNNAIRILPDYSEAYCQLGLIHIAMNNYEKALKAYKHAVKISPLLTDAYICISQIEGDEMYMEHAVLTLQTAISNAPHNVELRLQLGKLYMNLGIPHKASQCFSEIIQLIPTHAVAHYNLGIALKVQSRLDEALDEFSTACSYRREYTDAIIERASIKNMTGHTNEALEIIKPLIKSHNSKSIHLYSEYGEILKKAGQPSEAARVLRDYINHASITTPDLETIHYLLGDILDELEEYDEAFNHFYHANRLSNKCFNLTRQLDFIDDMRHAFISDSVEKLPRSGITSVKPIFIVGMPRSGTSLVEQILDSHALISGAGEMKDIADIFQNILITTRAEHENFFPGDMQSLEPELLYIHANNYLENISNISREATYVTDKLPQNFIFLGFIQLLFPNAHVIHCHRNPLDTCLSIYFHNFGSTHSYSHDLKSIADYYNAYQDLMSYWTNTLDLKIMHVRYEELVNDMEHIVKNIMKYLDLEWDENCKQFYKNKRTLNTFSREQIRKPIYTNSVNRWNNYKNYIAPLMDTLKCSLDTTIT